MDVDILESIGLSMNESKIYLALIELGSASMSDISKISKIHRSNVYDSIERLKNKGLVCTISIKNKTYYEAANPEKLINYYKEKELKLLEIIPKLKINQELSSKKHEAAIYEGAASCRRLLESFLRFDDDILAYGIPKNVVDITGDWFLKKVHEKRIKKKQYMHHIYNENARERIKYLNSLPYTTAKYLPKEYNSPVSIQICSDEVFIVSWEEPIISILIKHEKIAKTFRNYFKILYDVAKTD